LDVDQLEWSVPPVPSAAAATGGSSGSTGTGSVTVSSSVSAPGSPALAGTAAVLGGVVPSTRNNHATFVYGTKLYIHGGHDGVSLSYTLLTSYTLKI
jgi:hypothetical protein